MTRKSPAGFVAWSLGCIAVILRLWNAGGLAGHALPASVSFHKHIGHPLRPADVSVTEFAMPHDAQGDDSRVVVESHFYLAQFKRSNLQVASFDGVEFPRFRPDLSGGIGEHIFVGLKAVNRLNVPALHRVGPLLFQCLKCLPRFWRLAGVVWLIGLTAQQQQRRREDYCDEEQVSFHDFVPFKLRSSLTKVLSKKRGNDLCRFPANLPPNQIIRARFRSTLCRPARSVERATAFARRRGSSS